MRAVSVLRRFLGRGFGSLSTAKSLKLHGHLDLASTGRVEGWLIANSDPARRRRLKILLDGNEAGEAIAGDYRPDLKAAGIGVGDGCYALSYRLPALEPGEHVIRVMDAETGYELQGSPKVIWASPSTPVAAVTRRQEDSPGFRAADMDMGQRGGGLDARPAATATFEGMPVSLGVLNCNPYYITVFALAHGGLSAHLPLRVSINDHDIGSASATRDAGAWNGRRASLYRFDVPGRFPVAAGMPVQVSLAGTPLALPGGPTPITCRLVGALDRCDARTVGGWAACLDALDQRVPVDVLVAGALSETTHAARHRPDLRDLGLGDGNYGFLIEFPEPLEIPSGRDLDIRALVHGLGYELRYSPWYIAREPLRADVEDVLAQVGLSD